MKSLLILTVVFSVSAKAGQQFKTGSSEPLPELVQDLEQTYKEKIKDRKIEQVVVEGHTDQRGSDKFNQKLSKKRADAAANELIKLGADKNKVQAIGKGKSELLTNGTTEKDYATNRRVVVLVKSDEGASKTVISENKEQKCVEKVRVVERVVEKTVTKVVVRKAQERKNVIMLGLRKDFVGIDKQSNGNTASVYSKKDLVPDISYMRRQVLDSNFDAGLGVDSNATIRVFGGYEF